MITMKGHRPTFSVIIPTFNRARVLPRAIRSVLDQAFVGFELIIVDDGSTDDTWMIIQRINDDRIRYVYQENHGVSTARNAGVALARGRYLTFLDSDDEVLPDWLACFAQAFEQPQTGLVCCGCFDATQADEGKAKSVILPRDLGPLFDCREGLFLVGTFALRREVFEAVGGYAEELVFSENTELALRLIPHCVGEGFDLVTIAEPLVVYHKQPFDRSKAHTTGKTRLESVEYILTHHRDRFLRDSQAYGNYLAVAGVCAARGGEYGCARRYFASAIRAYPWSWKHYGRLFLALVPALGHRYWSRYWQEADI